MIYRENDSLHLIDEDRNTHRALKITDSLNYNEEEDLFSPNGEFCFLKYYYYSFRDNSLKRCEFALKREWTSDSTFLTVSQGSSAKILVLEHSTKNTKKDTVLVLSSGYHLYNCNWDYDLKRKKLYYSTLESSPTPICSYLTRLHVFDRLTQQDTVVFEYPKDHDPNCTIYYAGARIPFMQFSGDFEKIAFELDWALDAISTNIYTYWPDSNRTTMVTNGCFHSWRKRRVYWASKDTLAYTLLSFSKIFGLSVTQPTAVEKEDALPQPTGYGLVNYPNPFNGSTVIECRIPLQESGELQIYNLLGKKIMSFGSESLKTGNNKISWDGKDQYGNSVSSGVYFAFLRTRDTSVKLKPLKLLYMK